MEHWHSTSILAHHPAECKAYRALAVASGNVQPRTLDSQEGIENTNPYHQEPLDYLQLKLEAPQPAPGFTLTSNDHRHEVRQHLQARRNRRENGPRRRTDPDRPYLSDPKYLNYRARQRRDTGPDGKPVWDEPMEEAFQNALIHIKPMGRKKKSQHKKTYGRNELIAEYIFQYTGELRTRKQVSSHIQVLNFLLKGIPEWDALIIADEETNASSSQQRYYENSIHDDVQREKYFSKSGHLQHGYDPSPMSPAYTLGSNVAYSDKNILTSLEFEMWVSLPTQMESALHSYTRLQSKHSSSAPALLESMRNWRFAYPQLCPIVDGWAPQDRCDILLLDASFKLMSDFPPPRSKLGISLELDFRHPNSSNLKALAAFGEWSCTTHMYQHGNLIKEATYGDCHVSNVGKVKPFFESKWWAAAFTQLTERKRRAEDSKDEAAIHAASEASRKFFRGLTVMQQVFAGPSKKTLSHHVWTDQPQTPTKRMAILLWRFSQAQSAYVGTTTWQKLIPPPDRITTNSPPPTSQEMALPPLTMDTVVEGVHGTEFDDNHDFLAQHNQDHFALYTSGLDDELCQDGFMANEMASFAAMQASFSLPDTHQDTTGQSLHDINQFHFDLHTNDLHGMHDHYSHRQPPAITNNFFEVEQTHAQLVGMSHIEADFHNIHNQTERHEESGHNRLRQPLTDFDVTTSKILQEQMQAAFENIRADTEHNGPAMQQQAGEELQCGQEDVQHFDTVMAEAAKHGDIMQHYNEEALQSFHDGPERFANDEMLLAGLTPPAKEALDQAALTAASAMTDLVNRRTQHSQPLEHHQNPEQQWVAPVPTRPALHSHASYLARQESHGDMRSDNEEDHTHTFANMELFDANQLAAALSAHNAAEDHASQGYGTVGHHDSQSSSLYHQISQEHYDGTSPASLHEGLSGTFVEEKLKEVQ